MTRLWLLSLGLATCSGLWAQGSHGYVFAGPGGNTASGYTSKTLHIGAGGEKVFSPGIGVGIEVGYLGQNGRFSSGLGLVSPNGYYHFLDRRGKADPFVTAGYTLLFRTDAANLFNYGAGLNYWLSDHLGAKVEFRDHVYGRDSRSMHYWGFRFGVTFR